MASATPCDPQPAIAKLVEGSRASARLTPTMSQSVLEFGAVERQNLDSEADALD